MSWYPELCPKTSQAGSLEHPWGPRMWVYSSVLNTLTLWSGSQAWNPSSTTEVLILGQISAPQISGFLICNMEIMVVLVCDYRAISIKNSPDFYVLHQCLCIQKTQTTETWLLSKSHHSKGGTLDDDCKQRGGNNGSARIPNSPWFNKYLSFVYQMSGLVQSPGTHTWPLHHPSGTLVGGGRQTQMQTTVHREEDSQRRN